jgi:UDP-glucuronate decarboxylase
VHVFVTGGTGFFGKALLRYWGSGAPTGLEGARFTLLSRDPQRFAAGNAALLAGLDVALHEGDILRPDTLPRDTSFTHILHAATDSTTGPGLAPIVRFDQIVDGTRNVLDLARRLEVGRVLMTSSGGVYGGPPPGAQASPESWNGMPDPLEPQNAYSVAKRMAEHLCALYHDAYGLKTIVARCFAFVGEDLPLDAHFAIGNFIRDALAGKDITVNGDGTPIRSYLDQRDLARWLTALLLRGEPQRAYNVGSDRPVSIAELAHAIARHGQPGPLAVHVQRRPDGGQAAQRNCYLPDIARARAELSLDVEIGLEEAIAHTLSRHRARLDEQRIRPASVE